MVKILIREDSYIMLFEAATISDIHNKYYNNIPDEVFNKIVKTDPTWNSDKPDKMGKYGKWLLSLYMRKNLKLEDLYKANEYLKYFTKYYNMINNKDINTYKTLQELFLVVQPYMDNQEHATSKQDLVRKIKEGAEKVYEDNEWLIIVPHTEEASCYYGKGTQWCTAANNGNNMFEYYNDNGNLYININKLTHEKYQFHFETDSFMDETDSPIEEPICEEIGLTDGALNWYKNNVNEWEKICQEKLVIMVLNDSDNEIALKKTIYSKYWNLVETDSPSNVIASDLIINPNIDADAYNKQLYYNKYLSFKNTYGYNTLISYDMYNGSIYLVGYKYKYINKLDNDYDDTSDIIFVETVDDENVYEIISIPSNETIYKKNNSDLIHHAKVLAYNIIAVYKKNNLIDLVNCDGYQLDDIQLINDELQIDDYDYGIVLNSDGEEIKFDLDTFDIE